MLLNLKASGKCKKVVCKSPSGIKKAKVTGKAKSSTTLSTDKTYSSKFYFVVSSEIYDAICARGFIVEVTLQHQYLDKIKFIDVINS